MQTVKIGLVQTSCSANIEDNVKKSVAFIRDAAKKGAQIICLPEMYRTLYFCQTQDQDNFKLAETIPGPSTDLFCQLSKELSVVIIAPLFEKRAEGLYHNTVAVIDADGTMLGIYRKMHIPQDPGFEEKFYFTPGDLGFKVFKTKYATIGVLICWDQWYPEAARLTAMQGAQILFYPTAIGWADNEPEKEVREEQLGAWQTIQKSHSIANGLYVCAVNRVGKEENLNFWGNSFVSNPFGTVIENLDHKSELVSVVECDLSKTDFYRTIWPFMRDRRIDVYGDLTQRFLR